jgi:hypothetical protein
MSETAGDKKNELQEYVQLKKLLVHHYITFHKECRVHIFVLNNQYHYNGVVTFVDSDKIEILDDKTQKYLTFPLDAVLINSDMPYDSLVFYIKNKVSQSNKEVDDGF